MAADAVVEVLRAQYGLISRDQAIAAAMTPAAIRHMVDSARWVIEAPGVFGLHGHRPSWRRMLWRGHLHAGSDSVISHESAGRLRGFAQVPAGQVELIVAGRRRHPPAGVRWHRLLDVADSDVQLIDGLPVTSTARTVVDLASTLHIARLRRIVEQSVLDGTASLAEVGALLDRVRRKGKPGVRRLASVLDELGPGDGIPRSELERLVDDVIIRAGLPQPICEHPLPNAHGRVGFVDRFWPEAGLIVEADGRKWHARHNQMLADADRTLGAQALGYETSRLMWEHAMHDPAETAKLLRAIYLGRLAGRQPFS